MYERTADDLVFWHDCTTEEWKLAFLFFSFFFCYSFFLLPLIATGSVARGTKVAEWVSEWASEPHRKLQLCEFLRYWPPVTLKTILQSELTEFLTLATLKIRVWCPELFLFISWTRFHHSVNLQCQFILLFPQNFFLLTYTKRWPICRTYTQLHVLLTWFF